MALDPSIALGIKPVQIESPINQMAKIYEMQNAVQANKLNQLKMDEYTRGVAEDEAVRNYFAQQDRTSPDFVKGLYGVSPKIGQAYEKSLIEANKERAAIGETEAKTKASEFETKSKRLNIMGQSFGYVRTNPTPQAATMALNYLVSNGVIDKAQADEQLAVIAADPSPANIKALADQGFMAVLAAKDQLSTYQTQTTNNATRVLGINPVSGKAEVVQGSEAKMGISPADAQRIALDKQRLGLEERRVKVAETTGAPGYVKPLNATQQYKLDKLKTADKTNAKLFDASIDAELKNIDKLIGTETAPKLHKGLANATGPITSRLPTGRTDTANAEAYIKSLQSKASINSLQAIRGTAGAIGTMTEREWPRLESMKATLQESQGTDQFIQSLKDYREELKNMKLKSKEALNTDYSTEIGANIPSSNPNIDALLQKYPE
jgi:hypothetical protein